MLLTNQMTKYKWGTTVTSDIVLYNKEVHFLSSYAQGLPVVCTVLWCIIPYVDCTHSLKAC